MWPGTATLGGWRSPQAFGGTRTSTRELARSGKKNPNRERLGFQYWWSRRELNPRPEALYRQFYILSVVN